MKIKMKKFRLSLLDILAIIILYFFNYCTSEFLATPTIKALAYGVVVLFVAGCTLNDVRYIINYIRTSFFLLCFFLMLLVFNLAGNDLNYYIRNIVYMFIYIALAIYVFQAPKTVLRKIMLFTYFIDSFIVNIYTIFRLEQEPMLARYLATGSSELYGVESPEGVVSYAGVYGLVILNCVIVYLIFQNEKKAKFRNCIWIIYIIISFITIIRTMFTIAILLMFVGILFSVWMKTQLDNNTSILTVSYKRVLLIFVIIVLVTFSIPILEYITSLNIFSDVINTRLIQILNLISNNSIHGTDLLSRFNLYIKSGLTFLKTGGFGYCLIKTGEIGGHSQLLDGLGMFGYVFFFVIIFWVKYYKKILKMIDCHNAFKLAFIIFILESLVNTSFWARQTEVILFIVPMLLMSVSENNGKTINRYKENNNEYCRNKYRFKW